MMSMRTARTCELSGCGHVFVCIVCDLNHWYCVSAFICRYLILEYVSGGELFDYLVKRVRLPEREVRLGVHVCMYVHCV